MEKICTQSIKIINLWHSLFFTAVISLISSEFIFFVHEKRKKEIWQITYFNLTNLKWIHALHEYVHNSALYHLISTLYISRVINHKRSSCLSLDHEFRFFSHSHYPSRSAYLIPFILCLRATMVQLKWISTFSHKIQSSLTKIYSPNCLQS